MLVRLYTTVSVITPRQSRVLLAGAATLVVMSVAWAAAGLVWRLSGHEGGEPAPIVIADAPGIRPPQDLSSVFRFAPFGSPVRLAQGGATGLVLKGVVVARGGPSSALIAAGSSPARSYGVGETVEGGAVLASVGRDQVSLLVNGHTEILAFPPRSGAGGVSALTARAAMGYGPEGAPSALGGAPVALPMAAPSAAPGPSAALGVVQDLRQRAADNPQSLLSSVGATASAQGYRIGQDMTPEMRRAGLAPGDLIQRINGAAVGDVVKDRALFDAAIASGGARVEITRGGRPITLSIPLR